MAADETVESQEGRVWHRRKGRIYTLGVTDAAIGDIGRPDTIDFPDDDETYDEGETIVLLDGPAGQLEVACPLREPWWRSIMKPKRPEVVAERSARGRLARPARNPLKKASEMRTFFRVPGRLVWVRSRFRWR